MGFKFWIAYSSIFYPEAALIKMGSIVVKSSSSFGISSSAMLSTKSLRLFCYSSLLATSALSIAILATLAVSSAIALALALYY